MAYPTRKVSTFNAVKYRIERREERKVSGLCTRCNELAAKGLKDCQNCIDKTRLRAKERREECRKLGICISCGTVSRKDALRCSICSKRLNENGSKRQAKIKVAALTHYGQQGKLNCCWPGCDITDVDMLTLDHVNNNGAEHRRQYTKTGRGGGGQLYDRLIRTKFPKGFQTLCANHNLKKHIMNLRGVQCPTRP